MVRRDDRDLHIYGTGKDRRVIISWHKDQPAHQTDAAKDTQAKKQDKQDKPSTGGASRRRAAPAPDQPARSARTAPGRTPASGAVARPSDEVGHDPRRGRPERDAPRSVAGGHVEVVAARRAPEQRPAVRRQRPRAGPHRFDRRRRPARARSARRAPAAAARAPRRRARRTGRSSPSDDVLPAVTRLNSGGGSPRCATSCSTPASSSAWRGGVASRTSAFTPHSGTIGRQPPAGSTSAGVQGPAATTTVAAGTSRPSTAHAARAPARRPRRSRAARRPRRARAANAAGGGGRRDGVAGVQPDAGDGPGERRLEPRRLARRERLGASSG